MNKTEKGQDLVDFAVIVAIVCALIFVGYLLTRGSSKQSVPPIPLKNGQYGNAKEPVCKLINIEDVVDTQKLGDGSDVELVTVFTLNDRTSVYVKGWVNFQNGRYLYDASTPYANIPGKYLWMAPCPAGAKDLDQ